MKIRSSVICVITIAALIIFAVIWFGKQPANISAPEVALSRPVESTDVTPALASAKAIAQNTNNPTLSVGQSTDAVRKSKEQEMLEGLSTQNDVPIVFYGKIEDQFGNVIADATVNFGVRIYNGYESTVKSGQTVSDHNGFFKITGYKGERLGIGVQKTGYVFVSMNGSGVYSRLAPENERAHPDINNPVVVKMWKLQGAEPLVSIDQKYKLPYGEKPIVFDLMTGSVVSTGGDLEVIITRAPGLVTQRKENRRDWSIKFVPVNGGIIESDALVFEAPADGYQDNFMVQMNHDDPAWFDNIKKGFFLKTRNGQIYSKVSVSFRINDDPNGPMSFHFNGVANTNSSRNWEATASQ